MAEQLVVTFTIGVGLFVVAFLICYWPRRGKTFAFDPAGQCGAFEQHAKRYQELAKLILTLSTASIAFLVNFLVNLSPDASKRGVYSIRLESASPGVIGFLSLSSISMLLFLLFENVFYEDYVHSKYTLDPSKSRETYTAGRYAMNLTFGWTGLFHFFLAYAILAYKLFRG